MPFVPSAIRPWEGVKMNKSYSQKIAERQWNQPDKGELESRREETYIDDIVQKSHIEKELLAHLDGIETAFDGGAGCGRFSILLAKQGIRVTHFDISRPMLDKARELAEKAGVLDRLTFVEGALEDLGGFAERSFDLVMSFDAPISYTYPHQESVIAALVKMAKKRIMISVSSRLGSLPYLANPIQKAECLLEDDPADPTARWFLQNRRAMIERFSFDKVQAMDVFEHGLLGGKEEIAAYEQGQAPWCITYTFLPEELKDILERNGVRDVHMAGPGAYARTIPRELLVKTMRDPHMRRDFLDFCHLYDSQPTVCGMGKDNLFARGEIG